MVERESAGHRGDLHVRVPGGQEVFEGPGPRRRGVVAEEDDLAKAPASTVAACASCSAAPEPEQWLALLARREQHLGAAVVDDEADLLRRQHHVDRVGDRAQLVDRVVAHHPLPGVVGVQGDPVARLDADVAQAVGEPVRELVQLVEAEPAAVEYERRLVAEPAGRRGQHLTECLQHAASSGVDFAMTRPAGEGCASAMAEPIPLCTVLLPVAVTARLFLRPCTLPAPVCGQSGPLPRHTAPMRYSRVMARIFRLRAPCR